MRVGGRCILQQSIRHCLSLALTAPHHHSLARQDSQHDELSLHAGSEDSEDGEDGEGRGRGVAMTPMRGHVMV